MSPIRYVNRSVPDAVAQIKTILKARHLTIKTMISRFPSIGLIIFYLQTIIATCIIVAIVTNLLVIVGGSGKRWRRAFLLPWLIFYGLGVLVSRAFTATVVKNLKRSSIPVWPKK